MEELTNGRINERFNRSERRETEVTIKRNTRFTSVLRCDAYCFIGVFFWKCSRSSTPVLRCKKQHVILTSTVCQQQASSNNKTTTNKRTTGRRLFYNLHLALNALVHIKDVLEKCAALSDLSLNECVL